MKTPPPLSDSRRGFGFAPDSYVLLLGAFAVFLLFRPYQGIIHDARLYVGYAMAAIDPDGIGRDIVFVNDGQSKFSVYPLLMRSLAEWIGPSRAAMVLTYGGLTLWFAAFAMLVRRLLGERFSDAQVIAVIVLAVSLSSFYGGQGVFRFAEHFATPRAFAEAAVLAAFAAMLTGRAFWVLVAFGVGLAFHPLMTAPGIGVALWYAADSPRSRTVLVTTAIAATAILMAGTLLLHAEGKPFGRFDAEWMAALMTKQALVFLRTWRVGDAIRILLHLVTVLVALPLLNSESRRLVHSVLVVVIASLLLSALGADLAQNVLVTQGQAWRSLWILAALATVMLGVLLRAAWSHERAAHDRRSGRDLQRVASMLFVLAWAMVEINSTAIVFALLAALLWHLPRLRPEIALPSNGVMQLGAVMLMLLASVVAMQTWVTTTTSWTSPDRSMRWAWYNIVATGVPALLVLAGVSRRLSSRDSGAGPAPAFVSALAATALALSVMFVSDARTAYQRFIERELDSRANGVPAPLQVPRGGAVLWPDAELEAWALAGAPGWGTIVQGMPGVFDRQLAIAWSERTARLQQAGLLPPGQTGAETIAVLRAALDDQVVEQLCASPNPPSTLVIPMASGMRVGRATTFMSAVARALYPSSLGQPWRLIHTYSVVGCRS